MPDKDNDKDKSSSGSSGGSKSGGLQERWFQGGSKSGSGREHRVCAQSLNVCTAYRQPVGKTTVEGIRAGRPVFCAAKAKTSNQVGDQNSARLNSTTGE
jgi:hypothetical protein